MEDDEAHSPPTLELFQQVVELARKAVQNVTGENEEQFPKEDEVVEEEIVQDETVTQMEDDDIPQEAHMVAAITEEDSQKIDSAGDASLQKEAENVAEKEHQKVDTPQKAEETLLTKIIKLKKILNKFLKKLMKIFRKLQKYQLVR